MAHLLNHTSSAQQYYFQMKIFNIKSLVKITKNLVIMVFKGIFHPKVRNTKIRFYKIINTI